MGDQPFRALTIVGLSLTLVGCVSVSKTCSQYSAAYYEECAAQVRQVNSARMATMGEAMRNASASMRDTPPTATPAPTGATGFLRSQYREGTSHICVYDKLGSPYVTNIGTAEICPITVQ